jgi:hypothetical protein
MGYLTMFYSIETVASNGRFPGELEIIWKEIGLGLNKELCLHFPGGAEEKPQNNSVRITDVPAEI